MKLHKTDNDINKRPASAPADKVDGATIRRLIGYLQGRYKWCFAVVLVLIILSALASVAGSLFIGNVIDDYITPMLTRRYRTLLPCSGLLALWPASISLGFCPPCFITGSWSPLPRIS
ncbi:MAG: hypothetical protein ACRCSI_04650 [Eubacterium aggregans]